MSATRRISLIEDDGGLWTARDVDKQLTAQGSSREEALANLDAVIEAVDGEGGHEPTDEELRELGVDPEVAKTQTDNIPEIFE